MANSKRKCTGCKTYFKPDREFGPVAWCSESCMREIARKAAERARKQGEQTLRKARREAKERLKTRRDWLRECQVAFNGYIRARDEGLPCASCGSRPVQKLGGTMDCSHYRSVGSAPHMRFNVFNAAAACVKCNRELSGNVVELRKGLIARWGVEKVEQVEQDQTIRKWDIEYLQRFKRIFYKRTRHIKRLRNKLKQAAKAKCKQLKQEKAA